MPKITDVRYTVRINRGDYNHEELTIGVANDIIEGEQSLTAEEAVENGLDLFRVAVRSVFRVAKANKKAWLESPRTLEDKKR